MFGKLLEKFVANLYRLLVADFIYKFPLFAF